MRKGGVVVSLLAITAIAAGCSSKDHEVDTSGASVNYGQQYEADARPVRLAATNYLKYEGSLVSPSQAAPLSKALVTFADVPLAPRWPAGDEVDVRKLADTSNQEGTVLQSGLTANNSLQIDELEGDATAEAVKVRTDLGLPPPPSI
jgi:hypothetical protein